MDARYTPIYLLAEVAVDIAPHDIELAFERATILAKLGQPVTPIVMGKRIDSEAAALAVEHGVWSAPDGLVTPPRST